MGMFDAIKSAYSHYFTLNGRATRSEYWWFWLYQSLGYIVIVSACIAASVAFQDNEGLSLLAYLEYFISYRILQFLFVAYMTRQNPDGGYCCFSYQAQAL